MRYIVKIYNKDGYMFEYESNSRDSLKHAKRNICNACKVFSKKGFVISSSYYDEIKGWVSCNLF